MSQDPSINTVPLKLHWASGRPNFGDWLSPAICGLLSGRPVEHAPAQRCELIAVGSILHRLRHRWWARRTHVWGTGFIEELKPVSSRHHYHAVRGWRTAAQLRGVEISCVGDPGLLASLLLPGYETTQKKFRLGLVPHYKDREHGLVKELAKQLSSTTVLDVFAPPVEVLRRVAECEFILSSSLHGLIVADSLGVPNAWMEISGGVHGSGFKFADYYSVFGLQHCAPVDLTGGLSVGKIGEWSRRCERPGLDELKRRLRASFPFPAATAA